MHRHRPARLVAFAATVALAAGCATGPTVSDAERQADGLQESDHDLLFATEFPVANKAEALQRADEARRAGAIDKALYFYVKALKFDPQDADLLAAIGLLHRHQGNAQLAVRAFSMALAVEPDNAAVLEARGLLLLAHDEVAQAAVDLARAVELDATAWQAHNGLGLIADRDGLHSAALPHYDRALGIRPTDAAVLNNRGYSRLLAGDLEAAGRDLTRAAAGGHRQAWVNLGALHARQGKYDLAVDALSEVLAVPEACNRVAEISMENGDLAVAGELLERAIRLSPTYFPAAEANLAALQAQTRKQ